MSPSLVSIQETALTAIAGFLRKFGFAESASTLDAKLSSCIDIGNDNFTTELATLASTLLGLIDGGQLCEGSAEQVPDQKSSLTGDSWVDEFIHHVTTHPKKTLIEPSLLSRLDQAMSEPAASTQRQARVALTKTAGRNEQANTPVLHGGIPPTATEDLRPVPSSHYLPRRPGHSDTTNYDSHIPEEYRDDLDPGYRICELTEADLLAEIQEGYLKKNNMLRASAPLKWSEDSVLSEDDLQRSNLETASFAKNVNEDDELQSTTAGCAYPQDDPLIDTLPSYGFDDELMSSEAEKPSKGGGSMLPNFMRSAGSAMLAAVGAVSTSSGISGSNKGDLQKDPALAPMLESSKSASEIQGPEADELDTVPTFGSPSQDSKPPEVEGFKAPVSATSETVATPQPFQALVQGSAKEQRVRPKLRYADSGDTFYPVELNGSIFDSFPLRIVFERDRTGFEECKDFQIQVNAVIAARYQVVDYLGSAAFSRAIQCLDLHTNRMVCMKIIKNNKDFFDQSLDEIKLLKLINVNADNIDDKHCLSLIDCFYHKEHLIIVTELLRDNLYEFSQYNKEKCDEPYFTLGRLQRITRQLLIALEYIHSLWLIHADLKPENILIKSYSRCEVKVIDFGSSCFLDDQLTHYVQSRSYRAPEVILGLTYGQKIDIWSLGCIVAEIWTGFVLFQNDSIQSLLARIIGILGPIPTHMLAAGKFTTMYFTQDGRLFRESDPQPVSSAPLTPLVPDRKLHLYLPKRSSLRQRMRTNDEVFLDFLTFLLQIDPEKRPTASEALQHPWLSPGRYSDGIPSLRSST